MATRKAHTLSAAKNRTTGSTSVAVSGAVKPVSTRGFLVELSRHYRALLLFAALTAVYFGISLAITSQGPVLAGHHIATGQAIWLSVGVYVPFACVWFVAFIGYLQLRDYAQHISHTHDGQAFRSISYGVLALTVWLPFSAIMNMYVMYYRSFPNIAPWLVRLNNYANVIILLLAFGFIYWGSKQLLVLIGKPEPLALACCLAFIAFSTSYTFLTFYGVGTVAERARVLGEVYYLPNWITLLTVTMPRLMGWYIGVRAAINLSMYRANVTGKLYKNALTSLSVGVAGIVIWIVVLRSLQSVVPLIHAVSTLQVELFSYTFLAVLAAGYLLMARGARLLHRIEKL